MMKMTPQMADLLNKALADGVPALVGTASKDGDPQISPKGSVAVYDEHTLSYWERSNRSSVAHIKENPKVVVYYRNAARASEMPDYAGGALRFHGRARIADGAGEREKVWDKTIPAEQERDKEKKGFGVLIDVEKIELLSGKVVMEK
jgi:predicted pyridoxine 5'-phosphate oxidase superfamily flavin-nucleotide-binding protein